MEGEGFFLSIDMDSMGPMDERFTFYWEHSDALLCEGESIKNNEILEAAVSAATRYWEEKK